MFEYFHVQFHRSQMHLLSLGKLAMSVGLSKFDLEKLLERDQNHPRHSYLRMTDIRAISLDGG
uniref:Uncharacterized protein n=1 Tax=Rhizophagus irregularis (strain DAOM 181602 / DAOM 197198 / MUCL 43194) TaxID=747089 RepID=U9TD52_RHIID